MSVRSCFTAMPLGGALSICMRPTSPGAISPRTVASAMLTEAATKAGSEPKHRRSGRAEHAMETHPFPGDCAHLGYAIF